MLVLRGLRDWWFRRKLRRAGVDTLQNVPPYMAIVLAAARWCVALQADRVTLSTGAEIPGEFRPNEALSDDACVAALKAAVNRLRASPEPFRVTVRERIGILASFEATSRADSLVVQKVA